MMFVGTQKKTEKEAESDKKGRKEEKVCLCESRG